MSYREAGSQLVSVVIPLFNEAQVVPTLLQRLGQITAAEQAYRWEIVFTDDGSTDATVEEIRNSQQALDATIRLIRFSRNFGHQAALTAGMLAAQGEAVICMDADLQDPPELISAFLRQYENGYEVVYAIRQARAGRVGKKLAYAIFYRLFRRVAEIPIPLDAGDFGLMSKRAAELVVSMPERDIFLRGLRSWIGFRQIGIPYPRPERGAGETKYTLTKLLRLAASAFFGFSLLPLRLATSLGLVTVCLALCYAAYAAGAAVLFHNAPQGWPSVIGVVSFIGGAQLVCLGILGEYIGRIYRQTQARPRFVIAEQSLLKAATDRMTRTPVDDGERRASGASTVADKSGL